VLHEVVRWVPWVVFAFGMFLTFCVIFIKTESFRKGLLGSLFVGKTFAIVYWISGLDRTLMTLYIVNRRYPWVIKVVHITACEVVLVSFAVTAATLIAWPLIAKHLPNQIRKAIEEMQG